MNKSSKHIFSVPGFLWNHSTQLSGSLEIWDTHLAFEFSTFKEGHLKLEIPLIEIERVEEYLVFDLARNGLRVQTRDGRYNLFILNDSSKAKNLLLREVSKWNHS